MSDFPSHQQDKFIIRLPFGLRDRIKAKAEKNGRSMNAEIVQLLEASYPEASDVMYIHAENIRRALDVYERTSDPQKRLYLQHLVEGMATLGHDLEITFDEIEDD